MASERCRSHPVPLSLIRGLQATFKMNTRHSATASHVILQRPSNRCTGYVIHLLSTSGRCSLSLHRPSLQKSELDLIRGWTLLSLRTGRIQAHKSSLFGVHKRGHADKRALLASLVSAPRTSIHDLANDLDHDDIVSWSDTTSEQ